MFGSTEGVKSIHEAVESFCFDETSILCFTKFALCLVCLFEASQGNLYLTRQNSLQYGLTSLRYLGAETLGYTSCKTPKCSIKNIFQSKIEMLLIQQDQLIS